ncbi:MAG: GDP-mannose 4,6-dehydratase [Rudaea sp.]|uniref:GDP-mannose 4,6-dehydratase n=1 Tax=Rudaea sp. TaxID=2136325 RepID=UPI0039E2754D
MKQIFVTGATGFAGRHFRDLLDTLPDWRMHGASHDLDLRDGAGVQRAVAALPAVPDAVLHLAAQSNVPQAFADPQATFDINFFGTLRLLQALRAAGFRGRFLFVGSADAYGLVPERELPIGEDHALRPRNPYSVSKVAAEALAYQWSQTEGFDVVLARPFNHIGPGQDERFAVASFARQVAEIALGRREPRIETGDIDVTRDFTDVRDVVRAYVALLQHGESGRVYNIGSGRETRLREILGRLIEFGGVQTEIVSAPGRLRPAEQRRMCADTHRIRDRTGWQPRYGLDQTLIDILEYWKEKLTNE